MQPCRWWVHFGNSIQQNIELYDMTSECLRSVNNGNVDGCGGRRLFRQSSSFLLLPFSASTRCWYGVVEDFTECLIEVKVNRNGKIKPQMLRGKNGNWYRAMHIVGQSAAENKVFFSLFPLRGSMEDRIFNSPNRLQMMRGYFGFFN